MTRHAKTVRPSFPSADGSDLVNSIVEELIEAQVDLRRVSLDEMKRRLSDALRTRHAENRCAAHLVAAT